MKDELILYLKIEPRARERSNRNRTLVNILLRKYPDLLMTVNKDTLIDFVSDYNTLERILRQVLEKNPGLRGKDWNDGKRLSLRRQRELGYIR